jgi:hypothetical protein
LEAGIQKEEKLLGRRMKKGEQRVCPPFEL